MRTDRSTEVDDAVRQVFVEHAAKQLARPDILAVDVYVVACELGAKLLPTAMARLTAVAGADEVARIVVCASLYDEAREWQRPPHVPRAQEPAFPRRWFGLRRPRPTSDERWPA